MEREPIEQLHNLLHERVKVADKIVTVESSLDDIRKNLSTSLAQQCLNDAGPGVQIREDLMKEEQTYERLLQALEDMKAQLEERVRPVAEQVVQAEVERLLGLSEAHQNALTECLTQIDQNILSCRAQMNAYRQRRSDLLQVSQRLAKLGAAPVPIPAEISEATFGDVIRARVEGLSAEGKI